jgi:hypothetical protein
MSAIPKELLIGKGFPLSDTHRKKLIDIYLLQSSRKGHVFIFGTTRVGKTRLIEGTIIQDIKSGKNIVIIDPKIDGDLFSSVYTACIEAGRKDDLLFVSSVHPELSTKIGPLAYFYMEEELVNHIMSGVPTDDEFFYNYAFQIATFLVRSLVSLKRESGVKVEIDFDEIDNYCSFDKIKELRVQLLQSPNERTRKLVKLADKLMAGEQEYFGKVSSTISSTLTQMTTGSIGEIAGNVRENEFIRRLENNEGVVLYVQTGAMLQNQSAYLLGKVVISMIQTTIGRFFASGLKFEKELCIYIDEMSNCVYRGIEDIFNKGGGCNCFITALTQSTADIVAQIGEDRARKLLDNTNTKIVMRMNDVDSVQKLKILGGTKIFHSPQLNLGGAIRTTEVENEIIKDEDILRLKPREFFYFGFEGEFKGKTAPIGESKIKVIMPKVVGPGKAS